MYCDITNYYSHLPRFPCLLHFIVFNCNGLSCFGTCQELLGFHFLIRTVVTSLGERYEQEKITHLAVAKYWLNLHQATSLQIKVSVQNNTNLPML